MAHPFRDVAIVGVHNTVQARHLPDHDSASIALEGALGALADAGLPPADISTTSACPVAIRAAASSSPGMPRLRKRLLAGPSPKVRTSSAENWPTTASTSPGETPASASAPRAPSSAIDCES